MDVTQESFADEVLARSHEVPVVVDFWAEWCGPCRALGPVLEQAVAEREPGVVLAKVDVDANQQLAAEYSVRGIPAVKAFRNGHVVAEFVGAQPPAAVAAWLDELTAPSAVDALRESGELPEVVDALDAGEHERAFELLLARVADADGEERERLRETCVALFGDLGHEHPVVTRYRRRLAAALY